MVDFAEIYGIDSALASGVGMGPTWGQAVGVGITGILPGRNRTPDYGTRPVSAAGSPGADLRAGVFTDQGQYVGPDPLSGGIGGVQPAVSAGQIVTGLGIAKEAAELLGYGTDLDLSSIAPGGEPYAVSNLPNGGAIAKRWWTGTVLFVIDDLGKRWVWLKKQQRWKRVSTRKAFHIGRNPTAKNVRALGSAMAHHKKTAKIYGKLFPKKKAGSKHGHGCKCPRCV